MGKGLCILVRLSGPLHVFGILPDFCSSEKRGLRSPSGLVEVSLPLESCQVLFASSIWGSSVRFIYISVLPL